jgi:hypothetical protein
MWVRTGSGDLRLLIRINNVSRMYHHQNLAEPVLLGLRRGFPE